MSDDRLSNGMRYYATDNTSNTDTLFQQSDWPVSYGTINYYNYNINQRLFDHLNTSWTPSKNIDIRLLNDLWKMTDPEYKERLNKKLVFIINGESHILWSYRKCDDICESYDKCSQVIL